MDSRMQKLEQQKQILEQKMKQKRFATGMVQASDARSNSGRSRDSNDTSRELYCYDGPLHYSMDNENNPDSLTGVTFNTNCIDDNLVSHMHSSNNDLLDVEDDESSPVIAIASNDNANLPSDNNVNNGGELYEEKDYQHPMTENDGDLPSDDDIAVFVMEPAPPRVLFRCRITRDRRGVDRGMFPTYYLQLERPKGKKALLLAARKRKKSATSHYIISADPTDLSRHGTGSIGKLRSNALGTRFQAWAGRAGQSLNVNNEIVEVESVPKEELAAILYDPNVLGFKGPRRMTVLVPALADGHRAGPDEPLVEAWRSGRTDRLVLLRNKTPVWNDDTQSYVLNFHGRVTKPSVKNFQIIHDSDPEYVVMQFGRVSDDTFTMDFRYPLCALQAFAITLSSFDGKIACE